MVDGSLTRASALCVDLGVGRTLITSGSCTHPSHSCDGWVCDLGVVGVPLIFGLARRTGVFDGGLLTFTFVSGFQVTQRNCTTHHFFRTAFPSQLEVMVGDSLSRLSAFHVGLGVGGTTIASGSRV